MACAQFDYRSAAYKGRLDRMLEEKRKAQSQANDLSPGLDANRLGFEPPITTEEANRLTDKE